MGAELAEYTFVPWVRQGMAASVAESDTLGGDPGTATGRATVTASLSLGFVPRGGGAATALPPVTKTIELIGPADVAAIKQQAIVRTEPFDGAMDATPGELPYVEFYEEDFPWRYTPARAASETEPEEKRHKLRPWIALFVLRQDEFTLRQRPDALPVLSLADGVDLPPAGEAWAWAHAQISRSVDDPDDLAQAIAANPDHSLSRLLCPRRLVAGTAYQAFIVPAFELGRLAGLGMPTGGVPTQKASWGTADADEDPRYPVYLSWRFATGTLGDFETLARNLTAGPAGPEFGKRAMDLGDPGFGMAEVAPTSVWLEGALQPPDFERDEFPGVPGAAFVDRLESIVDLTENLRRADGRDLPNPLANGSKGFAATLNPSGDLPDDPIITPPAYGAAHAAVARLADTSGVDELAWLRELNLDPRTRAAAGLGAEIVRAGQEELMERAWNQVGRLEDANQRLREGELALAVAEALFRKHLEAGQADRLLTLTAAAQRALPMPSGRRSVRGVVDESRVPAAAQTGAFKRITRPQRKLMRRLTGGNQVESFQDGLLSAMNLEPDAALSAAPPKPEPEATLTLGTVKDAVRASLDEFVERADDPWRIFVELLHADLAARRQATPPQDLSLLATSTLQAALRSALPARIPNGDPVAAAIRQRVSNLINALVDVSHDGPNTATVIVQAVPFAAEFGHTIAAKTYRGVTVASSAPPPNAETARATTNADVQQFGADLDAFEAGVVASRPPSPPRPELPEVDGFARSVLEQLRPQSNTTERVASTLPGLRRQVLDRAAWTTRRLRPVMAHPVFLDPMFEALRSLSRDHILPNVSDLPKDTITLMLSNTRFIEAFLAGLNNEMARELLWREYPTDLRGTYFRTFWDTRDALGHPNQPDINAMHEWEGALGTHSVRSPDTLVLVIKGELLRKYPHTAVYAQEAAWVTGSTAKTRRLKEGGAVKFPSFHAELEPDVAIYGFDLGSEEARGQRPVEPGWFFVFKERPGQVRFGFDEKAPPEGLDTWDDLAWDAIDFPDGTTHLGVEANAGLAPTSGAGVVWGKTSADMASILLQSPVLYARHAEEMLPG